MKINRFFSAQQMSPDELKAQQDKQMREAAQSYEKYFLNEMVKAMRSTVKKEGGLLPQNFAEQIYSENLDQEYVDNWSQSGGVGLGDMIYQQLQEAIAPKAVPRPQGAIAMGDKPQVPDGPGKSFPVVNDSVQKKGLEIYQKESRPIKLQDE